MRVAFTGASGTGKTMLAQHVAETFGYPMQAIGARQIAKEMGFESPYDVDAAGKREEFQERLFCAKYQWEAFTGSFVTDRSYLDNLIYLSMHAPSALSREQVADYLGAMQRYDLLFVCPVGSFQNLGGDPARMQSPGYHQVYEVLLIGYLQLLKQARLAPECIVIGLPDLELRKDTVRFACDRVLDASKRNMSTQTALHAVLRGQNR